MLRALKSRTAENWSHFWLLRSGLGRVGRLATRLALLLASPHDYKGRLALAQRYPQGYIAPTAVVRPDDVQLGQHVFLGDRVVVYRRPGAGRLALADRVEVHRDTIFEIGAGGSIAVGAETGIQPRCHLSAYGAPIRIGRYVQIGPACGLYPYDHSTALGTLMRDQPLASKGGITIEDDAWLGYGVIVLSGVRIGHGAVLGAGSVVTKSIPDNAIAVGNPARVVRMRE